MNAGYQPPEHWTHGEEGGGRVLGEACHMFDLFRFLTAAPAVDISATGLRSARPDVLATDNFTATVRYADGSVCKLLYTGQGGSELPKEAMELHVDRQSVILDDYKLLRGFNVPAKRQAKRPDKGHYEELIAFHQAMAGTLDRRIIWEEALEVTQTTLEVDRLVRHG
jgi:predicted dehydrogenase